MKNTIKVLLFTSHVGVTLNNEMKKIIQGKDFVEGRIAVVEYVESHAEKVNASSTYDIIEKTRDPEKIYFVKDTYFIYNNNVKCLSCMKIVDVDISRPWCIKEYDGAEYIQYLDYTIVNKELNYGKENS